VVHCSRFKAHNSWSGDAHLYRVALD
jgi:hypothetical protein